MDYWLVHQNILQILILEPNLMDIVQHIIND